MSAALDWVAAIACEGPACPKSGSLYSMLARAADLGLALDLAAILACLVWIAARRPGWPRESRGIVVWTSGAFLGLLSLVHLVNALSPGSLSVGWELAAKAVGAVFGGATAVLLWRGFAGDARGAAPGFAFANGLLPRVAAGPETKTLHELETARRELETRVEERTRELSLVKARLETALRGAYVHAFSQDRELRYTWVYNPDNAEAAAEMIGRTDDEILPAEAKDAVIAVKRRVLETGRPETCEACSLNSRGQALYSLHIAPAFGPDGRVDGITGAAIDISRVRSLESEQRRLADELRGALHRYEIALRGSQVTLFTQDRDLRFTSISNPLFGREVADIVGRTDAEILPAESREQLAALVRTALATERGQGGEVSVKEADKTRWYDLHVEPLPGENGSIVGVTCAMFDITERKTGESHLRLLMRELTHRSKNLLAVIQSMARQTARHAGTIDDFLDTFGNRLQALATSHDLLVQEGWYGASLHDLTRRQLAKYLDGAADRVHAVRTRRASQAGRRPELRPRASRTRHERRALRRAVGAARARRN